jgi:hypothetical protein
MTPSGDRFWSHVEKTDTCLLWTGCKTSNGYGRFKVDGKTVVAHKWLWEQENGPVPDGLQLDHLCKVKHCVNLDHLEPVTPRENKMREHNPLCPQGHSKDFINSNGWLVCSTCAREATRRWRERNAA